jgi:hypothetical protein
VYRGRRTKPRVLGSSPFSLSIIIPFPVLRCTGNSGARLPYGDNYTTQTGLAGIIKHHNSLCNSVCRSSPAAERMTPVHYIIPVLRLVSIASLPTYLGTCLLPHWSEEALSANVTKYVRYVDCAIVHVYLANGCPSALGKCKKCPYTWPMGGCICICLPTNVKLTNPCHNTLPV